MKEFKQISRFFWHYLRGYKPQLFVILIAVVFCDIPSSKSTTIYW